MSATRLTFAIVLGLGLTTTVARAQISEPRLGTLVSLGANGMMVSHGGPPAAYAFNGVTQRSVYGICSLKDVPVGSLIRVCGRTSTQQPELHDWYLAATVEPLDADAKGSGPPDGPGQYALLALIKSVDPLEVTVLPNNPQFFAGRTLRPNPDLVDKEGKNGVFASQGQVLVNLDRNIALVDQGARVQFGVRKDALDVVTHVIFTRKAPLTFPSNRRKTK